MRVVRIVRILVLLFLFSWDTAYGQSSQTSPERKWNSNYDLSGIAALSTNRFVVVHDSKVDFHPAERPRLGIITPAMDGLRYAPVQLGWPEAPNDVEAICSVPGANNEYLIAESGYYETNRFGRIFRVRIDSDNLSARLLQTWQWPQGTVDIEGIALVRSGGDFTLLGGRRDGVLYTSRLNLDGKDETLRFASTNQLPARFPKDWRPISDLCLDGNQLFAAAAFEGLEKGPALGIGPFDSAIYLLATVHPSGRIEFVPSAKSPAANINAFKVEALCRTDLSGAFFAVATDDEGLGGTWRLFAAKPGEEIPGR